MITKPYQLSNYKTKPFNHQVAAERELLHKKAYALFWEMGCGKSKPIIDNAASLYCKGEIDGLLIISDNGAYRNWIDYEVPIHMPHEIPVRMAAYAAVMTKKEKHDVGQILVARDNTLDILVMNVEGFASDKAKTMAEAFLQGHYTMMVVDESTSIKTLKSKRTEAIIELGKIADYKRILTGTPITKGPLDIYAQFEFLGPDQGLLGCDSFVTFRSKYAITVLEINRGNGRRYYKTLGYKNLEELAKIIEPLSSRLLKSECLDLPEKVYKLYYVEHTPEQARMYHQIKTAALSEVDGGIVTATSAITALTKLHQINCGHVKLDKLNDEDGKTVDIESNRIKGLLDLLKEIDGKVIIWATFRRDIELIATALTETYGKDSFVTYYGSTAQNIRPESITRFRQKPECRFFISNPATGGKGITLVEATYAIYYSNSFHGERRWQSEDRIHRPGQKNVCTYIDIVTRKTVDVKIVAALKMKKDLASQVLDVYRDCLTEDID